MIVLKNIWTDLVEKRLWPVAAGLVIMLVAVPMMLAKPGEAPVAGAPPVTGPASEGELLALTRAVKTGFDAPPRVRDKRVDPFAGRAALTSTSDLQGAADKIADAIDAAIGGGGGGGGGVPVPPSDPGLPPEKPSPPSNGGDDDDEIKTVEDDLLSILVTEGENTVPEEINDVRTLSPLPKADNPFLVYVGPTGNEEAVFLVAADVQVSGEGKCSPSPTDCQTLTLGIGQTADFVLPLDNNRKISITVVGVERAKVKEGGEEDGQRARVVGAKAVKRMLADDDVVRALVTEGVKLGRR